MADRTDRILLSVGTALLGVIGGAASTGLLVEDAAAQATPPRRRDEERETPAPLLLYPPLGNGGTLLAGHSSHRSHRSHSSHYSGSSSHSIHYSGGNARYSVDDSPPVEVPRPRPVKPAVVSFVAFPGGRISIDGKDAGQDSTRTMKLAPGKHTVRVENRLLGETVIEVELTEGQTGEVAVKW